MVLNDNYDKVSLLCAKNVIFLIAKCVFIAFQSNVEKNIKKNGGKKWIFVSKYVNFEISF